MGQKAAIVFQGFVPGYRVRFYELLNSIGKNSYVIFHGSPPSNAGFGEYEGVFAFPNVRVRNYEFSFCGRTIIYQPIIRTILSGSYNAVVLGHGMKYVSNVVLLSLCKIIGKPVIWWGQGFQKDQDRKFPMMSKITAKVKAWLARSADMYIVYTAGGAERLFQSGVPRERIAVVRNTIDMAEQYRLREQLVDADPVQLRQDNGLGVDSLVLLYVGRIYKEKKVEELLYLVTQINTRKLCRSFIEAVIIGGGPELERLKRIGNDMPGVHFLGEIYDQAAIARFMRMASAMVIPGKVGLAVNHAFAHGVPVITRQHKYHAPEVEYIEHGENGLIIEGDFEGFVRGTAEYLNSAGCRKRIADGAVRTGYTLGMEFMVKAFDEAVSQAITKSRKSRETHLQRMSNRP